MSNKPIKTLLSKYKRRVLENHNFFFCSDLHKDNVEILKNMILELGGTHDPSRKVCGKDLYAVTK